PQLLFVAEPREVGYVGMLGLVRQLATPPRACRPYRNVCYRSWREATTRCRIRQRGGGGRKGCEVGVRVASGGLRIAGPSVRKRSVLLCFRPLQLPIHSQTYVWYNGLMTVGCGGAVTEIGQAELARKGDQTLFCRRHDQPRALTSSRRLRPDRRV